MKKPFLGLAAVCVALGAQSATVNYNFEAGDWGSSDWSNVGNSYWVNDTGSGEISASGRASTRLRLTNNNTFQSGSTWLNTQTFDFSQAWTLSTEMQESHQTPENDGADGMVLYFQNDGVSANPGLADNGTGFSGSWFALELDLYQNAGDPVSDEFTVWNGGSVISDYTQLEVGNIYPGDGIFFIEASYDGSGQLSVQVTTSGGSRSQTITGVDLSAFADSYIGFGAETGGAGENHDVLNLSVQAVPEPATISLMTLFGCGAFIIRRWMTR